jgi:hypothetical protein
LKKEDDETREGLKRIFAVIHAKEDTGELNGIVECNKQHPMKNQTSLLQKA